MKKYIYTLLIFIAALFLDVLTKYLVLQNIQMHEKIVVLGNFVQLTLVYNRGGLFGIMQGYQNFFLTVSIIVFIFIVLFFIFEKNKTITFCTAIGLITAGAIGNILDRLMGRRGVVDFIDIGVNDAHRWPTFNVADAVIVIGAVLLFIAFFNEDRKRRSLEKKKD